jgi:hypothetical protein
MLAACPAHLTLLDLIILMLKGRHCNKSDNEIYDSEPYITSNESTANAIHYLKIRKL